MPYPKLRVRPTGESLAQVKNRLIEEQSQRTVARQRHLLAEVEIDANIQDSEGDEEVPEEVRQATEENRVQGVPSCISFRVLCCGVCLVLLLSIVITVFVSITLFSFLERRQQIRDEL